MSTLAHRLNRKTATNVVFNGEPGIGKSYMATDIARMLEGKYRTSTGEIKDRFTVDQLVFTFSEFMRAHGQHTAKDGRAYIIATLIAK